jgi:septal ring factor EnvC (AmiA/AmiB activator)
MAITKEQVYEVADTISAEGGTPTPTAVRKRLGTGSFTTIGEHLSGWRAEQNANKFMSLLRDAAPDQILNRFTEVANDMWQFALDVAETKFQTEYEFLKKQVKNEFNEALTESVEVNASLESELKNAQKVIADQSARIKSTEENCYLLGKAISNLTADIKNEFDIFCAEKLEPSGSTTPSDGDNIFRLTAAVGAMTKRAEIAETALDQITKECNHYKNELKSTQNILAAAEAKFESVNAQLHSIKEEARKSAVEALELRSALAVAEDRLKQLTDKMGHS